jgi:hypothetical protein
MKPTAIHICCELISGILSTFCRRQPALIEAQTAVSACGPGLD